MLSHNMAIYVYKQELSCCTDGCAMLRMPTSITE